MPSTVLITGASTGIGRLAAETAPRRGHTVYASMRDTAGRNASAAKSLQRVAEEEKLPLRTIEIDVQEQASIARGVKLVCDEAGQIDVLANNAGVMSIGLAEGFTEEQAMRQMDVNFMGSFRTSRAVLPRMRSRRSGLIIHITSVAGRVLLPDAGCIAPASLRRRRWLKFCMAELAGTGVESVLVEPGPYPTHLLPNSPGPADRERLAGYGEVAAPREQFIGYFSELFNSAASPDTQEVADAILRLIEARPGERPLRTVCGMDFGAHDLNERVAPLQANALRALGMEHITISRASEHIGEYSAQRLEASA
jgi:NAD(P)-dependent dehydrogenase (short-subunit alcohol dehydrogenase family)